MKKGCLIFIVLFSCVGLGLTGCSKGNEPDDTAPQVESIIPADGAAGVPVSTGIRITFSKSMDANTVQTNHDDTQCSGNVQVSADNFSTCVRMISNTASNSNKTYTLTPMIDLQAATTYKIKVTTGATDAGGTALESEYVVATGFTTQ